ncbi:MAG: PilZ domain-containing protein, partial [Pseudomonadota bacterium]
MFSLTSDNQRKAFRVHPTNNIKVKITDNFIPVIDISMNGLAFPCENLQQGDSINISIQLADDILINTAVEVKHLSSQSTGPVCGCFFQQLSDRDRELINLFILKQQKKQ